MRWRLGAGKRPASRLTLLRPARLGNPSGKARKFPEIRTHNNGLRCAPRSLLCTGGGVPTAPASHPADRRREQVFALAATRKRRSVALLLGANIHFHALR